MAKYDVVSFLSDMGTVDESVGVCKAIIYQQAPHVNIIDISHDVAPFDVRAGALALTRAIQFLPNGVVLAAVDPGSPRDQRYIAVEMEEGVLVGPDNGILAPAAQLIGQPKRVVEITNIEYRIDAPGHVFAARDILAPAAGVIASGTDLSVLGAEVPLEQLVPGMLQLSRHDEGGAFIGEVWSLDRFGNVQVNITPEEIATKNVKHGDTVTIRVGGKDFMAKYVERYADLAISQLGILVDSTGMISIVKNLDFAARELDVKEGKEVTILPAGTSVTGRDITVDVMALQSEADVHEDAGATGSALNMAPLPEETITEDPYTPAPVIEPQVPAAPPQVFVTPDIPVDPSMPPDPFAVAPTATPESHGYVPQFEQPQAPVPGDPYGQVPAPSSDPFAQSPAAPVGPAPQAPSAPDPFAQPAVSTPSVPVPPPAPYVPDAPVEPPASVSQASPQDMAAPLPPQQSPYAQPPRPGESAAQPYSDSPSYFPPPVEQPTAPTPDVAPAYGTANPSQASESGALPQNVFDLFKNPEEEDPGNPSDPNQAPQQ